ncbi:hypothetical protein HY489_02250 [Candidatus Woesearchaeota archaeon]|nr:hypothetical protein [Candidatus Woesearchaeota archaeon]
MRAWVYSANELGDLCTVNLAVVARQGDSNHCVLYMPDTPEHAIEHGKCDPVPDVSGANASLRCDLAVPREMNLLDFLSERPLPRFDMYDDVFGFAYVLKLLVPYLDAGVVRELGGCLCSAEERRELVKMSNALYSLSARGCVMGGQRRMTCEISSDRRRGQRSYNIRPLEWLSVAAKNKLLVDESCKVLDSAR